MTADEPVMWGFRLFGLVVLLVALSVVSFGQETGIADRVGCSTSLAAGHGRTKFISKVQRVKEIVEELSKSRDHFLATGDMVDLFPTLYFHTTKGEFDRVRYDESPAAEMMIDAIIAFYDAYSANRKRFDANGSNSVEHHWKSYYKGAAKGNRSRAVSALTIAAVLLDGIDAHVAYDLPRAIRWVLLSNTTDRSVLKAEFDKMDSLFKLAGELSHKDIMQARKVWNKFAALDNTFRFGAKYAINGRHLAWELAVSDKKLPTKELQAVFPFKGSASEFLVRDTIQGCKSGY